MAWIIGRKSDKSIIEITGKLYENDFSLEELKDNIPINKGGTYTDYSFFRMSKDESERYSNGDSYQIVWTDDELTGISYTIEDSKPWAKLFTDKSSIMDDGIDYATIRLEVWKPDLSELYSSLTMLDRRITIITPKGLRYVRLDIVNGIAEAKFRSTESGTYTFPAEPKRYLSMRIFNQIQVEVDMVSFFEMI